ncbi:hypothetical protein [Promicromonospora kroppenstedtii]|uniref:hypothetical protein n=1 Tax=Promicromonospora kroppenstedtii TaxID=440482 RepID=UPI0004B64153|nr:hypothetical protein [Promicromonospora kroppenstedtii]
MGDESRVIRWSLGTGLGLFGVVVFARSFDLITVAVIAGLLGLLALGFAGYGALDQAAERAGLRRRARKVQREREQGR